jgi:monofunctional biosynthetic peptidoglycan transglycosylase
MNKTCFVNPTVHFAVLTGLTAFALASSSPAFAQEQSMKKLIDFEMPEQSNWTIVNDRVMGGRSSSSLELTDNGTATFSGILSLENNGGFASTRALFRDLDLSDFTGLKLRAKGDGRSYQLRIRVDGYFDGVAYRSDFATEQGEWTEVYLPFSSFQPTYRGRVPRGVPPLDRSAIRQIGFLLGDKIEGPFQLEIAWIAAVVAED